MNIEEKCTEAIPQFCANIPAEKDAPNTYSLK